MLCSFPPALCRAHMDPVGGCRRQDHQFTTPGLCPCHDLATQGQESQETLGFFEPQRPARHQRQIKEAQIGF